ncbi:hypothetical protein EPN52_05290 [bacterium]|nr:MAG: hypothetical protein EPN52_05290 [bacterium]
MWSREPNERSVFAWLLSPHTIEEFASWYYERAPLLVSRSSPDYYRRCFNLTELERVLYGSEVDSEDLRVVKNGTPARPETYLREGSRRVDADRVSALFAHGCTVVLDKVQAYSGPVLELCRGLEVCLRHRVNANLYLTPSGSQGFAAHYDTHDTVILQVEGAKHWRVYGAPVEVPLLAQKHDKKKHLAGEVEIDVVLRPGDLLYLPRGVMHEAVCTDEFSLHVTLGLHPILWIDVLEEAAKRGGLDEAMLRRSAAEVELAGGAGGEALSEAIGRTFSPQRLLETLQDLRSSWVVQRRNVLDGQLRQLVSLASLTPDSRLALRAHLLYELREDEAGTQLLFSGKVVRLPRWAAAMIRDLAAVPSLEVAVLARYGAEAPAVARRLVEEGFAVRVESQMPARALVR